MTQKNFLYIKNNKLTLRDKWFLLRILNLLLYLQKVSNHKAKRTIGKKPKSKLKFSKIENGIIQGNTRKFIVIKNKNKINLYCWDNKTNKKSKIDINKKYSFLIGYKSNKFLSTEYISIKTDKKITITNDIFGAYQIYYYKNKEIEILSNSIEEICKLRPEVNISSEMIYKYFSFGYLPFSQNTIYKNIKLIKNNSKISISKNFKIISDNYNLFKKRVNFKTASKDFKELFHNKIDNKNINQSALCLTSGYDSLLSLVYAKKINVTTFGNNNSFDIIGAKRRNKKFANNQNHLIYLTKNNHLHDSDFTSYACLNGGVANLSSINYLKYLKYLKSKNINTLYFSDHFETARRNFNSINDLKNKYFTPEKIVKKYFLNKKHYYSIKDDFLNEMNTKYKNNKMNKFYFYDRFLKGTYWKNQVCAMMGIVRINLPLDAKFINNNFNLLKKNKNNFFFKLFPNDKNVKKEISLTKNFYNNDKKGKDRQL